MKSTFTRIVIALSAFFAPALAFAQQSSMSIIQSNSNGTWGVFSNTGGAGGFGPGLCTSNICGVASNILYIINAVLVPLLFALAFIVFLYGIAKTYIFSGGEPEEVSKGHKLVLWGIIGFVVMISLWGLVNVVANTFGLYGAPAPALPRSY